MFGTIFITTFFITKKKGKLTKHAKIIKLRKFTKWDYTTIKNYFIWNILMTYEKFVKSLKYLIQCNSFMQSESHLNV